ncbi:hypothetical protein HWV62_13098 [Athelia sp. TMB]|nr:hypothetical protein HWV62_13098 [Athelia sp. TMB]
MPNKVTTTPNTIKSEPLSPTIEIKRPERVEATQLVSPPPGLDVEDGEITEDDTVVSPTVSSAGNIIPSMATQPEAQSGSVVDLVSSDIEPLPPAEVDRAKDVVLDLLGWGVTPEYLVDAGVSSEALYTIFKDLNLRLPTNLKLPVTQIPDSDNPTATEEKSLVLPPKLARA